MKLIHVVVYLEDANFDRCPVKTWIQCIDMTIAVDWEVKQQNKQKCIMKR